MTTLSVFIAIISLAALASLTIALLAAMRASVSGAPYLAATMASAALWCAAYAAELSSSSLESKVLWAKIAYVGIVCSAPSWLLFCVSYLGMLPRRAGLVSALCYLLPAATLVFVVLAPGVPLVWSDTSLSFDGTSGMLTVSYGPWFWVLIAYSYICIAAGSLVLLTGVLRRVPVLSSQVFIVVAAAFLPWAGNVLTVFGIVGVRGIDLTPPAFAVSCILVTIGLVRLRVLHVFPGMVSLARDAVVQDMQDGVIVTDVLGMIMSANLGAEHMLGKVERALVGSRLAEVLDDAGAGPGALSDLATAAEHGDAMRLSLGESAAQRSTVDVVVSRLGSSSNPRGYVLAVRDVTERVAAAQALRSSEERLRVLFEQLPVGVLVFDASLAVTECNDRLEELLGCECGTLVGQRLTTDTASILMPLCVAALGGDPSSYAGPFTATAGTEFWLQCRASPLRAAAGVSGGMLVAWDLTGVRQAERLIEKLAFHDSLTELPNRMLLIDRLSQATLEGRREGLRLAVCALDLDGFEVVHEALGREGSDRLLLAVAARLNRIARESDVLARTGDHQFALILPSDGSAGHAIAAADRMRSCFAEPFQIDGFQARTTASLGIALFPDDGRESEGLLRNAGHAMRRAQELGGDRTELYDIAMSRRAAQRLDSELEWRAALEREELVVHYQPQVDLRTGAITGVEALVRWLHPERGLLQPDDFLPLAAETGLTQPLDEWVMARACRDVVSWRSSDTPPLRLAINVGSQWLHSAHFVESVSVALVASGLPAEQLEVELTETAVLADSVTVARVLGDLREMGMSVALDDFGTGYSSLSHLHQLPIDAVKVDRSFVGRCDSDSDAVAIVAAVADLGHRLFLGIVAEGVETEGQLKFLQRIGCDEAQGYLFARPMPADEIRTLLAAGKRFKVTV